MKINMILFLLMGFLLTACQGFWGVSGESSYQDIFVFGKEVRETYDLKLIGFGGGYEKGIETFSLTFIGNQHLDFDEARSIYYDISTKFLEKINTGENLERLSMNTPFSIAQISLSFMFPKEENYVTGMGNGRVSDRDPLQFVYFFTLDSESKESEITYKEPYEELKRIVERQRGLPVSVP